MKKTSIMNWFILATLTLLSGCYVSDSNYGHYSYSTGYPYYYNQANIQTSQVYISHNISSYRRPSGYNSYYSHHPRPIYHHKPSHHRKPTYHHPSHSNKPSHHRKPVYNRPNYANRPVHNRPNYNNNHKPSHNKPSNYNRYRNKPHQSTKKRKLISKPLLIK